MKRKRLAPDEQALRAGRGHPFFASLPDARPVVIAHRGGSFLQPENTLEAFGRALEVGADVLEMDAHLTADGVPIVMHDDKLDRTTDASGSVSSFTLKEIQTCDAGFRFTPGDAEGFPCRGRGFRVPTLREVFTAFPSAHIIIDAKDNDKRLADAMIALVREFDRADRTLLASFHHNILVYFRKQMPGAATHASGREVRPLLGSAWTFTARFLSPAYEAVLVPTHDGRIPVTTRRFIRGAHRINLFVAAWTINDADEMALLAERGIDGVISDRPDLAVKIGRPSLDSSGQEQ